MLLNSFSASFRLFRCSTISAPVSRAFTRFPSRYARFWSASIFRIILPSCETERSTCTALPEFVSSTFTAAASSAMSSRRFAVSVKSSPNRPPRARISSRILPLRYALFVRPVVLFAVSRIQFAMRSTFCRYASGTNRFCVGDTAAEWSALACTRIRDAISRRVVFQLASRSRNLDWSRSFAYSSEALAASASMRAIRASYAVTVVLSSLPYSRAVLLRSLSTFCFSIRSRYALYVSRAPRSYFDITSATRLSDASRITSLYTRTVSGSMERIASTISCT